MSRKLIIYYSRSNATRRLANQLAEELGADLVAILDRQPRTGLQGYMRSLLEASRGRLPQIEPLHADPSRYELVLLGTPVWAAHAAAPMRRFLHDHARSLPLVAYFCTYGGRGDKTTFEDMCNLTGKAPVATLAVRRSELMHGRHTAQMDRFVANLSHAEHWQEFVTPPVHADPLHEH